MQSQLNLGWITSKYGLQNSCPVFEKQFEINKPVQTVSLEISSLGVYKAEINNKRVGADVLSPGWTNYEKRVQYQTYDITHLIEKKNTIKVVVGRGWYSSPMPGWVDTKEKKARYKREIALTANIIIDYVDHSRAVIGTDDSWSVKSSQVKFSEIYDGEIYDATTKSEIIGTAIRYPLSTPKLILQVGEPIREHEQISPARIFKDSNGSAVVDFGQEITGYVQIELDARSGDHVKFIHGEILDKNGNFYNGNYRSAKAMVTYVCKDGSQTWHPQLTFFGFRYIRIDEFPGEIQKENFKAIAVYSQLKRTGSILTSKPALNRLISNIFWSQKDNYLDVPTDCPQRDERLGWTGDAAAFIKAATYNFNVNRFFEKWLGDVRSEQSELGAIYDVSPDYLNDENVSAGWGDVMTIVPWQLYMTYGDPKILSENFDAMKQWINYITETTNDKGLWTGAANFGDWLGLDSPEGSYKGSSRDDLIATAYYFHSTDLVVKAGNVLKKNTDNFVRLRDLIKKNFQTAYPKYYTQTECVLALEYGLAKDPDRVAKQLVQLIHKNHGKMATGFIGTPHILHALSNNGYEKEAYKLLLRQEYPSWLYSVTKGATTTWEHWDSLKEDGSMWSTDMNSFNHYAYGSVIDWMYEVMGGIQPLKPGFEKAIIAPKPTSDLDWCEVSFESKFGRITSKWIKEGVVCRYEIQTPVETEVRIDDVIRHVLPGSYIFWGEK
ncbi:alpha-l-rhamnosidase [Paucilactobacillus vaccinostercus DSM 20634]|uniref:alpha-L-rhamnosidase n=1 Tax=Paucilactobacillus vaccinostercus DSM 20634 TaxID=1423813 RepID=A0A0R2A620_9LACO|nr:alpha-L-rhamnosidase [Paucilactobacillus vaccinostercus]KRM62728.1 alpha-l-rhamnosidase [Paucilactobacillus vaccinostercus DSM 20634]